MWFRPLTATTRPFCLEPARGLSTQSSSIAVMTSLRQDEAKRASASYSPSSFTV
jgi:hypothetical protein